MARSSGSSPNNVNIGLLNGMDYYNGHAWANTDVHWIKKIGSDFENLDIGDYTGVGSWHTYAWWRDDNGWWSFSVDGGTEMLVSNFAQDQQLTSFDKVVLDVVRDGSYIDWVKVYTPEPSSLCLLAVGALAVCRRQRFAS
jgi:hypothetical protein